MTSTNILRPIYQSTPKQVPIDIYYNLQNVIYIKLKPTLKIQTKQIFLKPRHVILETKQITIEPEQIIIEPEQIIIEPKQITIEPKQITIEPEQITIEPEQITFEFKQEILDFEQVIIDKPISHRISQPDSKPIPRPLSKIHKKIEF